MFDIIRLCFLWLIMMMIMYMERSVIHFIGWGSARFDFEFNVNIAFGLCDCGSCLSYTT